MRIAFLCSGLEPGRDGVGDYACRLGTALYGQGHTVTLLGLNDPFVDGQSETWRGIAEGTLPVLRLDSKVPWPERIGHARRWLESFQPDWVSVQFVCFGFHSKGLVHGVIGPLQNLCMGYSVHWMFHELWVSVEKGQPWGFGPWGWAQHSFILRLHRRLNPQITHTSNQTYAGILARHGIYAGILPLPGSFPVTHDSDWMESISTAASIDSAERGEWTVLGIFGAIQRQWQREPWLDEVIRWGERNGSRIALLGVGRLQGYGATIWGEAQRRYGSRVRFHHFGEQPTVHVVQFLRYIDCGVATGLASVLGKSSAVATMLEHQKTVLVPCWDLPSGMEVIYPGTKVVQRYGVPAIEPDEGLWGDVATALGERFIAALQTARID